MKKERDEALNKLKLLGQIKSIKSLISILCYNVLCELLWKLV